MMKNENTGRINGNWGFKVSPILVGLIVGVIYFMATSGKDSVEIIDLPVGKEMISWNDTVQYNYDPFGEKVKVVIFLKTFSSEMILDGYKPFIKDFPEISFITCFMEDKREEIKECLAEIEYPLPVFIDEDNKLGDLHEFIAFVVNENNELIKTMNPSFPEFRGLLEEYTN